MVRIGQRQWQTSGPRVATSCGFKSPRRSTAGARCPAAPLHALVYLPFESEAALQLPRALEGAIGFETMSRLRLPAVDAAHITSSPGSRVAVQYIESATAAVCASREPASISSGTGSESTWQWPGHCPV